MTAVAQMMAHDRANISPRCGRGSNISDVFEAKVR
jgi:hypothetical protein